MQRYAAGLQCRGESEGLGGYACICTLLRRDCIPAYPRSLPQPRSQTHEAPQGPEHAGCTTFTTGQLGDERWLICVDCDTSIVPVPLCAAQPCKQYAKVLDGDSFCYGHRHYWGAAS